MSTLFLAQKVKKIVSMNIIIKALWQSIKADYTITR